MQLSKILIGMVFMSLIVSGMLYFYTGGVNQYSPTDYNDTSLQKLSESRASLGGVVQDAETNLTDIKGNVDQEDAAEVLLTGAFKTAVLTGKSVTLIDDATNTAVEQLPISSYANEIIAALALAVIIVFIIAILMNIATKSPRT